LRQGCFSVSNYFEVASADQDASSRADCGLLFVAMGKWLARHEDRLTAETIASERFPSSIVKSTSTGAYGSP